MANFQVETIRASGAATANGTAAFPGDGYGTATTLRAQLNVTAISTSVAPTLDVVIEDSLDGTNWNVVGTFTQKTAVGREVVNVTSPFAEQLRARWTVGGVAASFTFSLIAASDPV